jgi:ATP-dependent DNA helicase DinG
LTQQQEQPLTLQDYLENFPFPEIRPKQREALEAICDAFNSGYQFIVLEAPTGFGKSPVAVCVARTLGSSYICSATKELQMQYTNDFPYFPTVKGMDEFPCLVKEDFERNRNYYCSECGPDVTFTECPHTSVAYGPCRSRQEVFTPVPKEGLRPADPGCRYRPRQSDYEVQDKGTDKERIVFIGNIQQQVYNNTVPWLLFRELHNKRTDFLPCGYYDQRNKGILATHTILNYSNFQIFLRISDDFIRSRKLLVLDEGHLIENEVVDFTEISVSRWSLSRYIRSTRFLENFLWGHGYADDILTVWIPEFLDKLYEQLMVDIPYIKSYERRVEANEYLEDLKWKIDLLRQEPENWIVTEIDLEKFKVKFKPLDASKFCDSLLNKCEKTLIMSATILDIDTFCRYIGLPKDKVKFISIDSDFPVEHRPIYALNTQYLNYKAIHSEEVQRSLVTMIDKIMNKFNDAKGIIHTTSYDQVRFIQKFLSVENKKRLIATDPKIKRELIVSDHFNSDKPSVLISPSMRLGLDLKDNRSRFQIIVKVPYPSKGDRWTYIKRERDSAWYNWQTALALVQAYGRSVRSKDDWAHTFVLDSAFESFVKRNKLPNWFTEAIKQPNIV